MREILFRGKRADTGKWIEGYPFFIWSMAYISWGMDGERICAIKVIPETISQFTGLTDKNGVKIFEGDVLLIPDYSRGAFFGTKQPKCKIVIKYGLQFNGHGFYGTHHNKEEIEIIGNIHDNPELLK